MKLIVDLGGKRAQELNLSPNAARLQLANVLLRHNARGHDVQECEPEDDRESHYVVRTPEGQLEYWLEE